MNIKYSELTTQGKRRYRRRMLATARQHAFSIGALLAILATGIVW